MISHAIDLLAAFTSEALRQLTMGDERLAEIVDRHADEKTDGCLFRGRDFVSTKLYIWG